MSHFRRWMTLCENVSLSEKSDRFHFWRYLAEKRQISAYQAEKQPMRLNQFLRADFTVGREGDIHSKRMAGGLKDPGGDVRAIVGGVRGRPGLVNNVTGQSLDDATLRAWQAGFFPEFNDRPTINDLLDKIAEDHNGNPVYSHYDQDAIDAYEHAQEYNSQVSRMSSETGISPEGVTADQFWDAVRAHEDGHADSDDDHFSDDDIPFDDGLPHGAPHDYEAFA